MANNRGNSNGNQNRRPRIPGFDLGGSGGPGGGKNRWKFSLAYILGALLVLMLVQSVLVHGPSSVPLSTFFNQLDQGQVSKVVIAADSLSWTTTGGELLRATLPPNFQTQNLASELHAKHVQESGQQPSALTGFLVQWLLPIILLGAIWIFLIRRMAGGGAAGALNLGKNKVKIYDRKEMKTTFADVVGLDEAVEELSEIVEFLRTPKKYQRLGGRIPKGVLLAGPPGCGKTLLARAVAGEAAVPFFYMSSSEFVEMFVGLGAARVRELFNQAKEKAPCLVFLDELDTIGKSRSGPMGGSFGGHDEREQTLNLLLVEMDGFDTSGGVIIMAATNRADVLDPALLRPGRFDRQVIVDRADLKGRHDILKVHARGVAIDPTVELQVLAARTPGFTGADLANVVNEAALLAARREKNTVGMEELEEAIDRVVAGLERKSRVMSEKERVIVATHEMGHALVALRVPHADPVHRVTIIPRGMGALGMTMQRPLEDRYLLTEPELKDRLAILLGGRTAEEIAFNQISTGAQNDLQRATEIAKAMVVEFGMSERVGPLSFGDGSDRRMVFPGQGPEFSPDMAQIVDEEVKALVTEAHDRAREILTKDRDLLDQLAKVLMKREVLQGKELRDYVDGKVPIPDAAELQAEADEKRLAEANGHKETAASGPSIIPSAPYGGDIPSRPD